MERYGVYFPYNCILSDTLPAVDRHGIRHTGNPRNPSGRGKLQPLQLLEKHFGYKNFRPQQEEVITHVLAGRDAVVLMPTGGGKSLCYQVPALALQGLAVVVSPLIALMKDQVQALLANGIPAAFLNSTLFF